MLELLRKHFFFSLHRAAMDVPTFIQIDPIRRMYIMHQRKGFRVEFKEEEVQRWVVR